MGPALAHRLRTTCLVLAALAAAPAVAGGQEPQRVSGAVEAQFGAAVAADGTITGSSSTIPVDVTRERVGGTLIVTIVPR